MGWKSMIFRRTRNGVLRRDRGGNKGDGDDFLVMAQKRLINSKDGEIIRFWKVPFGEQA